MTTNQTKYVLEPRFDSRKSFYKKAIVTIEGNRSILTSYSTIVAEVISGDTHEQDQAIVYGTHSPTTLRHIKEFLKQFHFQADSKAQIENDYMEATK